MSELKKKQNKKKNMKIWNRNMSKINTLEIYEWKNEIKRKRKREKGKEIWKPWK